MLLAGAVDVDQLGDRWHLPQQSNEVETTLLAAARPGVDAGVGGPAELPFDAGDELLDRSRRGSRFLALNAEQRVLVLGGGEPDLDRAAHRQRCSDQGGQNDCILAQQAPARSRAPAVVGRAAFRHSITSSARSNRARAARGRALRPSSGWSTERTWSAARSAGRPAWRLSGCGRHKRRGGGSARGNGSWTCAIAPSIAWHLVQLRASPGRIHPRRWLLTRSISRLCSATRRVHTHDRRPPPRSRPARGSR